MTDDTAVSIYCLADPRDGADRYVGQTISLDQRHYKHCSGAGANIQMAAWIGELARLGLKPTIRVLEQTVRSKADERERYWIGQAILGGARLLNLRGVPANQRTKPRPPHKSHCTRPTEERPRAARRVACHLKVLLAQKELRDNRSISLRKLAIETKVREYTVYGFANNTLREYPAEAVAKICEYLGCEVGDLLKLEDVTA